MDLANQGGQLNNEQYDSLLLSLNNVMNVLRGLGSYIENEFSSRLLSPDTIEIFQSTKDEIHYLLKQTEIYLEEVNHIRNPSLRPELVSLIIEKQPFPKSVNQNKPLKDSVILQLITGSCVTYRTLGPVVGSILIEYQARSKQQITIQNNIAEINSDKVIFNV